MSDKKFEYVYQNEPPRFALQFAPKLETLAKQEKGYEHGLPHTAAARKETPMYSGLRKYFPDALAEVSKVSFIGNQQHNPGQPLHWARQKSQDQLDAADRHLTEYSKGKRFDERGNNVLAQVAWRVLAQLQLDIEAEQNKQQEQTT